MDWLNGVTPLRRGSFANKVMRNWLMLFCAITLSACGGGGGGSDGGKSQVIAPSSPNSYLPTSSETKWFYADSDIETYATTTRVAGTTAQVLNYPTGGKEYYATTTESISFAGFYSPSTLVSGAGEFRIDFRFDQAIPLLGSSARAQKTISTSGTANIQPIYGNKPIHVYGTSSVVGTERITVPFGTFETTHVTLDLYISATIEGYDISIPWNVELWFAEDVGIVRRVQNGDYLELRNFVSSTTNGDNDSDGTGDDSNTGNDNSGDPDTKPTEPLDSDGDGIINEYDTDDDNDGVVDIRDHYPLDKTRHDKLASDLQNIRFTHTIGGTERSPVSLAITGTNIEWTLESQAQWLTVSKQSGLGATSVDISADTSSLALGKHSTKLLLTNQLDETQSVIDVSVDVALPKFTFSQSSITLDLSDDWQHISGSLEVSLNTGTHAYPVTLTTAENLLVTPLSGVSETAQKIDISLASSTQISEGENHFTLNLSTNVLGHQINDSVEVKVLASRHALLVPDRGIAFTKFPTKSKLTAKLDVLDSYNLSGTQWTATTNVDWLTITAAGSTADQLVINANTEGLEAETLHYAEIFVTAVNDTIANPESIKVVLWIGNSDPVMKSAVIGEYQNIEADPVRPYVYVNDGLKESAEISIYNSHTQKYLAGLESGGTHLFGDMAVSEDGRWLYAGIDGNSIAVFDLTKLSLEKIWQGHDGIAEMFTLAEPSGKSVILAPGGYVYEAQSGQRYTIRGDGHWYNQSSWYNNDHYVSASLFGNRFCAISFHVSPYTLNCYELDYNSYRDDVRVALIGTVPHGTGSNARAVAVNKDGSRAYPASGAPYDFPVVDVDSMTVTHSLPADAYPNGITMGENDEVHGIIDSYYGPKDLWIYRADGSERFSTYASGSYSSLIEGEVAVSGDGYQTFVSTGTQLIIINSY